MRRSIWLILLLLVGCSKDPSKEVVVFTSHDRMFSEPVLDAFEKETGLDVRLVTDTEATKTTGLVNRLLARKGNPEADVFWNNEIGRTLVLQQAGVLAPYTTQTGSDVPAEYRDPEGHWTGFAARARVILYNTKLVTAAQAPRTLRDLADPRWHKKVAIANPLFGTTAAHAAALFAAWGDEKAEAYFHALKANDIAILPENATVRDLVARGEYAVGLTDTDDANGAVLDGFPVRWHLAENDSALGATLVLPNTVALIEGGPNGEHAKALIDYLLSPEVEEALAASRAIQIPLNPEAATPENVPVISSITRMDIDFAIAAEKWPRVASFIETEFLP